jgi:hypothetical protein
VLGTIFFDPIESKAPLIAVEIIIIRISLAFNYLPKVKAGYYFLRINKNENVGALASFLSGLGEIAAASVRCLSG